MRARVGHVAGRARITMVVAIAVVVLAGAGPRAAVPSSMDLEAALLITFARYVEWPADVFASPASKLVLGVVAEDDLFDTLARAVIGKNISGRLLVVRRVQWDSNMAEVQLLFIGPSEKRRLTDVIERLNKRPVLTVSGLPDFAAAGGMITISTTSGRLGFAVNAPAAESTGLRFSSFLLQHATNRASKSLDRP